MFDNHNEGFALYIILILIIAGSIFVLTLYHGAYINIKLSKNLICQQKAFYAAEAALIYSKVILEENKGIPLENERGDSYTIGDVYEKRKIFGDSNFEVKFFLIEDGANSYKVEVKGNHDKNNYVISAQYNEQFELIKYKKIL